jgi:acyl-CoA thioester hydrolase
LSHESRSTLRVRYAETDQMGIAHHAEYLAWLEVGRTDYLRELGMTYRELEQEGLRLPVTEIQARYVRPAHYDDVLEIRTRLESLSGARMSFTYAIHREGEDAPLAVATTHHAAVDPSGRPRRLPAELRRRLA